MAKPLLILGPAGCGKSRLLRELSKNLVGDKAVLVPKGSFTVGYGIGCRLLASNDGETDHVLQEIAKEAVFRWTKINEYGLASCDDKPTYVIVDDLRDLISRSTIAASLIRDLSLDANKIRIYPICCSVSEGISLPYRVMQAARTVIYRSDGIITVGSPEKESSRVLYKDLAPASENEKLLIEDLIDGLEK